MNVLRGPAQNLAHKLLVILDVFLALAFLDAVERGLGDEHMATVDQVRHMPEEEGEQKRPDVRTVHVGVRHQDHLVVAKLGDIEVVLADARADGRDHRADFFVRQHLVVAGLLNIQDLAFEREDGLIAAVAARFRGPARGLALHEE